MSVIPERSRGCPECALLRVPVTSSVDAHQTKTKGALSREGNCTLEAKGLSKFGGGEMIERKRLTIFRCFREGENVSG